MSSLYTVLIAFSVMVGMQAKAENCLPDGLIDRMTPAIRGQVINYVISHSTQLGLSASPADVAITSFQGTDNSRGECLGGYMAYAEILASTKNGLFHGAIILQSTIDGFSTASPSLSNTEPYLTVVTAFAPAKK